jgi:hypothetical protein
MMRVLRPGGRLALQEVTQGPAGPPHYPVIWADTPTTSFLLTGEVTRQLLFEAGFTVLAWEDKTALAIAEAAAEAQRGRADRPALGVHLVVGASFAEKARNSQRNMAEGRIELINAVGERR